ncbi:MAG: hypothetical protein HFI90_03685 [Clostridia bacterium]|nr:hypothetical protein [Clostridia bacterium]
MKKTWIAGLMAAVLLLSGGWVLAEDIAETCRPIYFNGVLLENAQALEKLPTSYDDGDYLTWGQFLPYAAIAQKLGYTTTYDSATEVVTSVKGNNYYQFDLKNHTTYLLKNSAPIYFYDQYGEWNGTFYLSLDAVRRLLDIQIDWWTPDAVYVYDIDTLTQTVRPRFDAFYAWLEQIPNLTAYTCEGSETLQLTAGTKRFGIQLNGGMDSNLRVERNGQEILATSNITPDGLINLFSLFDADSAQDARRFLSSPIAAGVYQNQDGTFVLTNKMTRYQFADLIPSLQNQWYLYDKLDNLDDSYKRGWLQVPDNAHNVFPNRLRLLQLVNKDHWDVDYLLHSFISNVIYQYGDQGMEAVNRYIDFAAKLLSPPYLSASQSADGSAVLSYQITRDQYQALLTEYQITASEDVFDSFLYYLRPDVQINLQFSDTAFQVTSASTVDMTNFPAEYLLDDVTVHAVLNAQISGTVGPADIRQPEVKTTAMLEEAVQKLLETEGDDIWTD